jgi:hypothetical protein
MKDIVSDETVTTKLNSYFSGFWFIFYEFRKFSEWTSVTKLAFLLACLRCSIPAMAD